MVMMEVILCTLITFLFADRYLNLLHCTNEVTTSFVIILYSTHFLKSWSRRLPQSVLMVFPLEFESSHKPLSHDTRKLLALTRVGSVRRELLRHRQLEQQCHSTIHQYGSQKIEVARILLQQMHTQYLIEGGRV